MQELKNRTEAKEARASSRPERPPIHRGKRTDGRAWMSFRVLITLEPVSGIRFFHSEQIRYRIGVLNVIIEDPTVSLANFTTQTWLTSKDLRTAVVALPSVGAEYVTYFFLASNLHRRFPEVRHSKPKGKLLDVISRKVY